MSISFKERGRKITVTIDGDEYDFLDRHAKAMNACSWTDGDDTAGSVFQNFAWTWTGILFEDPDSKDESQTLAGDIVESIEIGPKNGGSDRLDRQCRDELRAAFHSAGLLGEKEV